MKLSQKIATLGIIPILVFGFSGCGGNLTENSDESTASTEVVKQSYPNNVIDIRTTEEYATGHLDQSINLPYSDEALFASVVAIMNKDLVYEIYGGSKEDVAEVVSRLENSGFTNIKNLGDVNSASKATGLEIIQ